MKNLNRAWTPPFAAKLSIAVLASACVFGQGFELFGPGPSPEGVDLSGSWTLTASQDANLGTAAGAVADYGGIPINEASRIYALAWSASRMTLRQEQCAGYVPPYFYYNIGNFRFWQERDPHTQSLVAIKMYGQITEGTRTIWMDGRPHPPPYAAHTWAGFSTGKWEGNVLSVYTTHIKRGFVRANGLVQTDEATLREHFVRHGDLITYFAVTTDPAYIAEPLSKTVTMQRFTRDPNAWLYACDDGEQIVDRPPDQVPSYLYGQNPYLREYSVKNQLPLLGALGGPETMYPEFKTKIKDAAAAEAAATAELLPSGPARARVAPDPNPNDGEIHVLPVQGNVYMLVGDGANITVQTGDEGVLVVDSGTGKLADKIIAAVRKLSDKPITFIVNTSFHSDHTGGNVKLRAVGYDPSTEGSFFSGQFADAGRGATIIGHLNVLNRMSAPNGTVAPTPSEGWPSDTFWRGRRRKFFNDEGIEIFYQPNAITDGDSIVLFRHSEVIATGDIFTTTQYPFIDTKNGGSVQGEIDALNAILDKTVYKHDEEGGTMIIPGHGRLCDEYDVAEYREMVAIVRDRVQALINKGATLDQVKAARLTADYDPLYGALTGPWTTDMFVEAVYTSLKQAPAKTAGRN
jgi:glyoxylase-like metal-dependent hydrolase (beta-lactamase superfamily II)